MGCRVLGAWEQGLRLRGIKNARHLHLAHSTVKRLKCSSCRALGLQGSEISTASHSTKGCRSETISFNIHLDHGRCFSDGSPAWSGSALRSNPVVPYGSGVVGAAGIVVPGESAVETS